MPKTTGPYHEWISTMVALVLTPDERIIRLSTKPYECNLTGDPIINFLRQLLRRVRGPIVLSWSKAPFIAARKLVNFWRNIHGFMFTLFPPARLNLTQSSSSGRKWRNILPAVR